MKESKVIEGRWWIFGNDKPEHFGVLRYSPEHGLKLEIKIARSISIGEILGGTGIPSLVDVIHGRDSGDQPITLFGCAPSSGSRSCGLESYECHPRVAIIGEHIESWSAAKFQKINIRFSLFHSWMGKTQIKQNLGVEDGIQIQIESKPAIEIPLSSGITVKINWECHTRPRSANFEIEEEHFVSLEFSGSSRSEHHS